MDTISIVCQFFLSLSILIVLHEMGHFAPAKWFKTRVEKFYLFFDFDPFKSLWKIKKGETEYGIGWLPLGGYVKISGMVDESMDTEQLKQPPQPWEFRSKPAWQRLIIMIGGVTVNFILGFFIFGMMLWYFGKAYVPISEVRTYGLAYDSVLIRQGFQQGDVITKIGDKPFTRVDPGMFIEEVVLGNTRSVTLSRNGKDTVLQLSVDIASQITGQKIAKSSLISARVPFEIEKVNQGPAQQAGLQKGDKIVSFNGKPTPFFDEFATAAWDNRGQKVTLGIDRNGTIQQHQIDVTSDGKIGVMVKREGNFKIERETYSFGKALPAGVKMGWDFLTNQVKAFGQMFKGNISVKDNLGSVISIGKLFSPEWNWEIFWNVTASLSIILAFMNLLPIPALDGGYVLFLIWEVLTGKKVSDKFMERAVTVGFFLLLGLMVFALGLDVWRHFLQKLF
ncbi:MAG: RIP metalloprotease RseP [Saprospiraceae bacterium]|nr:RIP metalloprotease RseP [Saprospiraceae bacterium]